MSSIVQKRAAGLSYLEREGGGIPLLFLHGIGSHAGSFTEILRRLPSGRHAIAWNAPGYQDSTPVTEAWPCEADYAARLVTFLDALAIKRVIVVGHSLGTLMGARFAADHPDRVAQLVLAASACGYGLTANVELPEKIGARIKDLAVMGNEAFAKSRAPRLVFEPLLNPEIVARVEHDMSCVNREGYTQAVRMLASGDLEKSLSKVTVDTRFIIGANDCVTPEQQTLRAALARVSGGGEMPEIVRINQAGHAVYQQKPDEFNQTLLRMIDEVHVGADKGETL